jgi:hypothetical protein
MCEYSGRLIAWLDQELSDQELPDHEATNVEWHVAQCAECRRAVSAYREVSEAFLVCYETAMAPRPRRKTLLWTTVGVAVAAAAMAAILLIQPRVEKLSIPIPSPPRAPAMAFQRPPAPIVPALARRNRPPSQWFAVEPTVQVALPADALFPPGAVPPGFSFIADVRP